MANTTGLAFHACRALEALEDPRTGNDDVETARRDHLTLAANFVTPATEHLVAWARHHHRMGEVDLAATIMRILVRDHGLA